MLFDSMTDNVVAAAKNERKSGFKKKSPSGSATKMLPVLDGRTHDGS